MISGLSAAFHAAKNHVKKQIAAKFKSRDVRVVPDPARQTRSGLPVSPPEEQPHLNERKVDEPDQPVKLYLKPSDEPDPEQKDTGEAPVSVRRYPSRHPNPLTWFTSKTMDDIENQEQPLNTPKKAQKDALAKLGFELSELKRDARRLRRRNQLKQYTEIEQSLQTQPIEATLTLLKSFELTSLEHHLPVLENLFSTAKPGKPAVIETEPAQDDSLLSDIEDEEIIPDIPTNTQPRAVQHFHDGKINLVIGDITRLKQDHNIPVEAIICPAGGLAKSSPARDQVLTTEPGMATDEFQSKLNRLQSGSSALMPSVGLADQGVKYILHPITPRPGEPEAHNLLLSSYVTSISNAIEKGVSSIALPVMGDELIGLNHDNACKLALGAVLHCLSAISKEQTLPKIYFVYPDKPESRPQLESMQQKIEDIPESLLISSTDNPDKLPVPKLDKKDTLRLMAKILPSGHAWTTRGKLNWMNKEIEQLCKMIYQGKFDVKRFNHITAYLHDAQMKMYNLVETGSIAPSECPLLEEYFEQRIEMLEIYERKHNQLTNRRLMTEDAGRYNAESRFASCPLSVKMAFTDNFDNYCNVAFEAHHLQASPVRNNTRDQKPAGKISRPVHGVMNACRTSLWVKALIHLYQKHGDEEACKILDEEIPLIQMAAIYSNSSTLANQQARERESAEFCKQALIDEGVDHATAEQIASAISGKSKQYSEKGKSIIEKVLHDAIALEKLRHCESFQLEQELDFISQFSGLSMAVRDIERMTKDVAKTIHRQKDMIRAPVISLKGAAIDFSPSASFSASQKEKWEHAEYPYSALESSVEKHSQFLESLLNDD